jgi:hypothetical protein
MLGSPGPLPHIDPAPHREKPILYSVAAALLKMKQSEGKCQVLPNRLK